MREQVPLVLRWHMVAEDMLDLGVKLSSPKRRGTVAILPAVQSRQPPAAIFYGEGVKDRSTRAGEGSDKIAALVGGHCGIEKNQRVLAFSRELCRERKRHDEGQLAVNFLQRLQERV